jgi:hypothetical protein
LTIRDGKGRKGRVAMLQTALKRPLRDHVDHMKRLHESDLAAGRGAVALPDAPRVKYPNAPYEWARQWVFPATRFYVDRVTGERRRQHLHESVVQKAVREAVWAAQSWRP